MNSTVSIAIALYNNETTVERCVRSVINQTYQQLEVLIIDDGSTDSSLAICKQIQDKRIRLITKRNEGLSSSRQRALELATADYICFIDADDYLLPTYVEHLLMKITTDKADVCLCSTLFMDQEERRIEIYTKLYRCKEAGAPIRLSTKMLNNGDCPINITLSDSWNKMYRREFLISSKVKFILPKGYNGTDSVFNQKLAFHEPIYTAVSSEEYVHVIYTDSAVHRKNRRLFEGFLIIFGQLMNEASVTNKAKDLNKYFSVSYCQCLKAGIFDLLHDGYSVIEAYRYINPIHSDFINKSSTITFNTTIQNTFFQKVFVLIYKYVPLLLGVYYRALSWINKEK